MGERIPLTHAAAPSEKRVRPKDGEELSPFRTAWFAERLFESVVVIFAIWTLCAHASLYFNLSLDGLTVLFSASACATAWAAVAHRNQLFATQRTVVDGAGWPLVSLMLAGSTIALLAIRPDLDDTSYIARTVLFVEDPRRPLDLLCHSHALLPKPDEQPLLVTQLVELAWGSIARLAGQRVLDVYHFLVPVAAGALLPAAWFLALSKWSRSPLAVLIGTAAIVLFLCIAGSEHRSHGNFAFVRIWQGKVLLMSIGVPVFIAFTFDFFGNPGFRTFGRLVLFNIAAVGFSSSALFLFPALAACLAAGRLAAGPRDRATLRQIGAYEASLFYIVATGLFCLGFARTHFGPGSVVNDPNWPTSLGGAMRLVFGGPFTGWAFAFYLSTLLACVLAGRKRGILLATWTGVLLLALMNPLWSPWVAAQLTSANAFWRLLFLLPFPLSIGICTTLALESRPLRPGHAWLALAMALMVSTAAASSFESSTLSRVRFGFQHKVERSKEVEVENIVAAAAPGPMLAPRRFSSLIPMYTSRLPQIVVRGFEIVYISEIQGDPKLGERRLAAAAFVGGEGGDFEAFSDLLSSGLRNVVLAPAAASTPDVRKALSKNGFREVLTEPGFVLFSVTHRTLRQRWGRYR